MAGQETEWLPVEFTEKDFVGGPSEGTPHALPLRVAQPLQVIDATPTDDTKHG
jgi:hypothetical protein